MLNDLCQKRCFLQVQGRPHSHGFVRGATDYAIATVTRSRSSPHISVVSGIRDVIILKTTMSGFAGFLKDENTSLPDTTDRTVATNVSADWTYVSTPNANLDFCGLHTRVRTALLDEFYGEADKGTFSASVQQTLYKMGQQVITKEQKIDSINLNMPNIHFLPCKLLANHGLKWTGEVHIPTNDPNGTINATVQRSPQSRL